MYGECINDYYRCQYYESVYDPSCSAPAGGSGGSAGSAGSAGTAGSGGDTDEYECHDETYDGYCINYYHRCYYTTPYYDETCYDEFQGN
jgi:hypothetical protein